MVPRQGLRDDGALQHALWTEGRIDTPRCMLKAGGTHGGTTFSLQYLTNSEWL
jgi:hypothetical protein